MREIKFRGFSIDNQKWVYGHYLKDRTISDWHYILWLDAEKDIIIRDEIYAESLGQYSGTNGINGIEIYEGDKVECFTNTTSEVVVKAGCFGLLTDGEFEAFIDICGYGKVIGNRFDDQE